MYLVSLVMRHLEEASHSIAGFLPEMYRDIGLVHIEERAKYVRLFGTLSIIRALKPLADEGARYRSRGPEKR
jgi:hypothetical protein